MSDRERANDGHEELLTRISRGADAISASPTAGQVVRGAVRRRRRRRVAQASAGVAVTVLSAGLLVGVLDEGGSQRPAPAQRSEAPRADVGDVYRPAGFFRDVLGGGVVPVVQRHHLTRRELFYSRMEWTPPGWEGPAYLADIALERYVDEAATVCARLAAGSAVCRPQSDGAVVGRWEVRGADAFLDPLRRAAPLRVIDDASVRGVTYLHPGGLAVSVLVCDCGGRGGAVLATEPPASYEQLEEVAGSDTWLRD